MEPCQREYRALHAPGLELPWYLNAMDVLELSAKYKTGTSMRGGQRRV